MLGRTVFQAVDLVDIVASSAVAGGLFSIPNSRSPLPRNRSIRGDFRLARSLAWQLITLFVAGFVAAIVFAHQSASAEIAELPARKLSFFSL
jgi:hypothetical protein